MWRYTSGNRQQCPTLPMRPKILVVDDEPLIVEFISAMLAKCGYEICVAYDGAEAVAVAKDFLPDCVVTGIMMPRMDGIAEAREILRFHPDCKIVFHSSALTDENLRREIADSGLTQSNAGSLGSRGFSLSSWVMASCGADFRLLFP